jgi:hypothetical protein
MENYDLKDLGGTVADSNREQFDLSDLGGTAIAQEPIHTGLMPDVNESVNRAKNAWDIAKESNLTLTDANTLQDGLRPSTPHADGLVKRFGKQLYNSLIANTLHELGKSESSAVEVRAHQLIKQWEKENNVNLPDALYLDQLGDWTNQLTLAPEAREDEYLKSEPQYQPPKQDVNPFAAYVTEPTGTKDKIVDAIAGVIGFTGQVCLLQRLAPTMPKAITWETVNLANGGKPGTGAAMQVTLGKINQLIPNAGLLPAAGRASAASILFGTTTYLGGGDTEDILINMGIPFAFEGLGITKQVWAKTPNKALIIESLKKKAPALESRSFAEIDKSISDTLTNVSQIETAEGTIGYEAMTPKERIAMALDRAELLKKSTEAAQAERNAQQFASEPIELETAEGVYTIYPPKIEVIEPQQPGVGKRPMPYDMVETAEGNIGFEQLPPGQKAAIVKEKAVQEIQRLSKQQENVNAKRFANEPIEVDTAEGTYTVYLHTAKTPAPKVNQPEQKINTPKEKVIYTSIPTEWKNEVLWDWGNKGLRSTGNRYIKGRKSFPYDSTNLIELPTRLPRETMDLIKSRTDEFWKVNNKKGENYYLAPKKIIEDIKAELGEKAFDRQPKPVRTPKQLLNDLILSANARDDVESWAIGQRIQELAREYKINENELTEIQKKYIKEYDNAKANNQISGNVRERMAQEVSTAKESDPDSIEAAERYAIQNEEKLNIEIGDFLDGLIEPKKPVDLLGRPILEGGASGKQSEFLNPENYKTLQTREQIESDRLDIKGQRFITEEAKRNATARIMRKGLRSGIDPQDFADLITIGGYYFESGIRNFADWSSKMRDETGEISEQRLKSIFAEIAKEYNLPQNQKTESDLKERKFITSIKEQFPDMADYVEGQYTPRSTDKLAIKARNLILDNITKAEEVAKRGNDDISVAVASELLKYYNEKAQATPDEFIKNAYYEKAAEIANESAAKLTELGRAVQAASILSRLTPEGMTRFAAKEIKKYNAGIDENKGGIFGLRTKIPELTPEQAKFITTEMNEVAKMPEGEAKAIRLKKLQDNISDIVPTPTYKRIIAVWKAGLLTGVKTSGVNILANASHYATEAIKDIPATMVDKTVSLFTGERTVTPTLSGTYKGGIEGTRKGLQYIKTGYDERNIGTKLDYKRVNIGKGKIGKALQTYTDTVFHLIGAEDEPFYYASKLRSLYEQAKVQAINNGLKGNDAQQFIDNLLENPTEKMLKYAAKDAETAVFQNDTVLSQAAKGVQRLPGGEIVVPFARTPSAVAMQIVNYSPVGIAKTVIENIGKGKFDQREFSKGVGRGMTGTAVLVIGGYLFSNDLLTLDRPKNEREQKLWELEGRLPNSIKINGEWRSVQVLGAAGNLLLIGGHFNRSFKESGSPTEAMANALGGSAKSFTEQTFLKGVNQFTDALSDPQRSAPTLIGNTLASIIPTIVSDVAKATDTTERRAVTTTDRVKMRIPGLRETLEPQINVLGKERTITANPLEIMIDPTRPSKDISDSITKELRRLWDAGYQVSPTLLGDKNGYKPLTPKENSELWRRAGQITNDTLSNLVDSETYASMDDFTKADAIGKIVESAKKITKAEAVIKKLTGLQGQAFIDTLGELQKSGLAEKDLFPEITVNK